MNWRPWALVLCLAQPLCAGAATLLLCVDSNPWAPYTFPDRDGSVQRLLREAAQRTGQTLRFVARPWTRCEREVELGQLQGAVGASATPQALKRLAFPRRGPLVDTRRALVTATMVLLRRSDSAVQWDGQRVTGLQGPVLYIMGYDDIEHRLQALGLPTDGGGQDNEVNARKLLAQRGGLMVTYEHDAQLLLQRPEFAGALEQLPQPLGQDHYYLALNPAFYQQHQAEMERLWDAVRRLNEAGFPG